ncbi:hypothetical protein B0T25DRAFT_572080 [Lasiosphaeria hispida]|uniref:ATPase AAA-type core domain-containing protein n=1 Tax=Lasiosphaeria hispida TaxID=260671 RepID=A0AAJ0HCG0_9PEZI|nr:hypothetical protein B0T25DRAFT_572080 [Lasiosphaeria hispida]
MNACVPPKYQEAASFLRTAPQKLPHLSTTKSEQEYRADKRSSRGAVLAAFGDEPLVTSAWAGCNLRRAAFNRVHVWARDVYGPGVKEDLLLRVPEYYDGILFLTTNRLRSFDIAVQSRIRMCLSKIIWESVCSWVQKKGKQKIFNGRQIKNVVSTAMALAHAGNRGPLRKELSEVALNTSIFQAALADQDAIFRNNQFRPRR